MPRKLTDMQFDEVSLVDRAANQFADVLIAKNDSGSDEFSEIETALSKFADEFAKAAKLEEDEIDTADDGEDGDEYDDGTDEEEEPTVGKAFPPPKKDDEQNPSQPATQASAPTPGMPAAPVAGMPPHPGMPPMMGAQHPMMPGMPMAPGMGMPGMPMAPQAPMMPQMPQMPASPQMASMPQVQLPPEVVQYIKALEARVASLSGNNQGNFSPLAQGQSPSEGVRKMGEQTQEENLFGALEKMLSNNDDPAVAAEISKAMDLVTKAQSRAEEAEKIAKEERDYRLEQEYISKAQGLNLPVAPEDLGPVLKRMDERMSSEDVTVLMKALMAGSEALGKAFDEVGSTYGAAYETLSQVGQAARELVSKSGHKLTPEQATAAIYEMDPSIYDQYLSEGRVR